MKRKRNKRLKTLGFILEFSQSQQMVDPMVRLLDVPIEHGAIRPNAQLVGGPVNLQPVVRIGFVLAKFIPHLRVKDLRTSSGQASESSIQ